MQGGCIIRAGFLDDIKNAYKRNPDLENLVLDEWFANKLAERQDAWRDVVKIAITNGQSQLFYLFAFSFRQAEANQTLPPVHASGCSVLAEVVQSCNVGCTPTS